MSSAASMRAARPCSPGHTRLRRKRRSSASVASRGARSMPARQTTSGIRSGGSPLTADSRTTVETPSSGSRSTAAAIPVRIAIGVQAQSRARADLEQRDRTLDAAQRGQQGGAAQRLVGLQAAARALRDELVGMGAHPLRPLAIRPLRRTEHPRDGEHERRLTVRRRDAAEDRRDGGVGGDPGGPVGVEGRPARSLVAREAAVALGDVSGDGGCGIHRTIVAVGVPTRASLAARGGREWRSALGGLHDLQR